jgi:hypothetical protein
LRRGVDPLDRKLRAKTGASVPGKIQWISGSDVGAVPSRKSKSQPSFACFTWREKMAP